MSAATNEGATGSSAPTDYRVPENNAWAHAWKIAAVLGVVGLILSAVGWGEDPRRFAFSWLFAFMAVLTVALGSLFLTFITFLTGGGWAVSSRRIAELFAAGIPILALAFVPVWQGRHELYEWAAPHGAGHGEGHAQEHGGAHGAESGHGDSDEAEGSHHSGPQTALHHELMEHKAPWLDESRMLAGALLYFLIWIGLAFFYFGQSTKQDETSGVEHTRAMQRFAPLATILFGTSLTFAAFDWVMSLEPTWYSTIYGVYIFAGCAVSGYALVIAVALGLQSKGLLGDAMRVDHYHDLGKMLFGFIVFHAYVGASQLLLIWYANIPEETVYYYYRWHAQGWINVSVLLILGHFVGPFLFLISRNTKRSLSLLGFGAAWMLAIHVIDIYWFVMPNYARGELVPHWLDVACLLAVAGTYLSCVFLLFKKYPLIPTGDPRLSRALNHHL